MKRRIIKKYRWLAVLVLSTWCICEFLLNFDDIATTYHNKMDSLSYIQKTEEHTVLDPRIEIFQNRRTTLLNVCKNNEKLYVGNNSESVVRSHFVVDRTHNFVYCAMEKIGSTFWRRLFQIISGSSKAKSPFDIAPDAALGGNVETFRQLSFDDIHTILETSNKFIISRDPYSRLFSGYMDKLFSANVAFWNSIGKSAIAKIRRKPSAKSLKCGHDLNFSEFIRYYIFSETFNINRDGHFLPMFDHCRPCQVKYDIIAKMETLSDDTLSVLKILNMTNLHDTLAKEFLEDTREDSFKDQTQIVFNSLDRTKECLPILDNLKRMWFKFQCRGLISKHVQFPFTEAKMKSITQAKFINALKQSVKETKDKKILEKYRKEFLFDAYKKVPKEDIRRLHTILKKDCKLFGYDCEAYPWIRNAYKQNN